MSVVVNRRTEKKEKAKKASWGNSPRKEEKATFVHTYVEQMNASLARSSLVLRFAEHVHRRVTRLFAAFSLPGIDRKAVFEGQGQHAHLINTMGSLCSCSCFVLWLPFFSETEREKKEAISQSNNCLTRSVRHKEKEKLVREIFDLSYRVSQG